MSAIQDGQIWFVLREGKRYGPVTFKAVVEATEKGLLGPEALVWCLGWAEWRTAGSVPGLFEEEPSDEEIVEAPEEVADAYEVDGSDRDDADHGKDVASDIALARASAGLGRPQPEVLRGRVRLAVLSIFSTLVIFFLAAWVAILLGIVRVQFLPSQSY
jgi:hypothetical protein